MKKGVLVLVFLFSFVLFSVSFASAVPIPAAQCSQAYAFQTCYQEFTYTSSEITYQAQYTGQCKPITGDPNGAYKCENTCKGKADGDACIYGDGGITAICWHGQLLMPEGTKDDGTPLETGDTAICADYDIMMQSIDIPNKPCGTPEESCGSKISQMYFTGTYWILDCPSNGRLVDFFKSGTVLPGRPYLSDNIAPLKIDDYCNRCNQYYPFTYPQTPPIGGLIPQTTTFTAIANVFGGRCDDGKAVLLSCGSSQFGPMPSPPDACSGTFVEDASKNKLVCTINLNTVPKGIVDSVNFNIGDKNVEGSCDLTNVCNQNLIPNPSSEFSQCSDLTSKGKDKCESYFMYVSSTPRNCYWDDSSCKVSPNACTRVTSCNGSVNYPMSQWPSNVNVVECNLTSIKSNGQNYPIEIPFKIGELSKNIDADHDGVYSFFNGELAQPFDCDDNPNDDYQFCKLKSNGGNIVCAYKNDGIVLTGGYEWRSSARIDLTLNGNSIIVPDSNCYEATKEGKNPHERLCSNALFATCSYCIHPDIPGKTPGIRRCGLDSKCEGYNADGSPVTEATNPGWLGAHPGFVMLNGRVVWNGIDGGTVLQDTCSKDEQCVVGGSYIYIYPLPPPEYKRLFGKSIKIRSESYYFWPAMDGVNAQCSKIYHLDAYFDSSSDAKDFIGIHPGWSYEFRNMWNEYAWAGVGYYVMGKEETNCLPPREDIDIGGRRFGELDFDKVFKDKSWEWAMLQPGFWNSGCALRDKCADDADNDGPENLWEAPYISPWVDRYKRSDFVYDGAGFPESYFNPNLLVRLRDLDDPDCHNAKYCTDKDSDGFCGNSNAFPDCDDDSSDDYQQEEYFGYNSFSPWIIVTSPCSALNIELYYWDAINLIGGEPKEGDVFGDDFYARWPLPIFTIDGNWVLGSDIGTKSGYQPYTEAEKQARASEVRKAIWANKDQYCVVKPRKQIGGIYISAEVIHPFMSFKQGKTALGDGCLTGVDFNCNKGEATGYDFKPMALAGTALPSNSPFDKNSKTGVNLYSRSSSQMTTDMNCILAQSCSDRFFSNLNPFRGGLKTVAIIVGAGVLMSVPGGALIVLGAGTALTGWQLGSSTFRFIQTGKCEDLADMASSAVQLAVILYAGNKISKRYVQEGKNCLGVCKAKPPAPPPGGVGCFLAGTSVLMADGTYKNIEDIQVGEKVAGWDLVNNKAVNTSVLTTFVRNETEYLNIEYEVLDD